MSEESFDFFCYFDNILRIKVISANAKIVYLYLCRCHGKDGKIYPKVATISQKTGISLTRTKYALKELVDKAFVQRCKVGRTNEYSLSLPQTSPEMGHIDKTSPDVGHVERTSPDTGHVTSPDLGHQIAQIRAITYNKTNRKEKQNNVVVVSPDIKFLLEHIRDGENLEDTGLLMTIRDGLSKYDTSSMVDRIEYANEKANGNYPGFLATMIKEEWVIPEKKKKFEKEAETAPTSAYSPLSLAGKTILYHGEKYTIDPDVMCIWPEGGGVLPIGLIMQGVKDGSIEVIEDG
jgi:hypothetical protein